MTITHTPVFGLPIGKIGVIKNSRDKGKKMFLILTYSESFGQFSHYLFIQREAGDEEYYYDEYFLDEENMVGVIREVYEWEIEWTDEDAPGCGSKAND